MYDIDLSDEDFNEINEINDRGKKRLTNARSYGLDNLLEREYDPEYRRKISSFPSDNYNLADQRIMEPIEALNQKGLKTLASCAGYNYPGHCINKRDIASPYVLFEDLNKDKSSKLDTIIKDTDWSIERGEMYDPIEKKSTKVVGIYAGIGREENYSRKQKRSQWDLLEQNINELI